MYLWGREFTDLEGKSRNMEEKEVVVDELKRNGRRRFGENRKNETTKSMVSKTRMDC